MNWFYAALFLIGALLIHNDIYFMQFMPPNVAVLTPAPGDIDLTGTD